MHHIVAPGFVDRPRRSDCTAGQMDGEAGWWTTRGNIGLPPLARVMGVGRQQQPYGVECAFTGLLESVVMSYVDYSHHHLRVIKLGFSHLSTHFFVVSLNLLRSSNEQGCARRVHCIMCAVFSVARPHSQVVSPS